MTCGAWLSMTHHTNDIAWKQYQSQCIGSCGDVAGRSLECQSCRARKNEGSTGGEPISLAPVEGKLATHH
jgi:hypothetical protein